MSFDNTSCSVSVEKRYSAKDPSILVSVRLEIFKGRSADGKKAYERKAVKVPKDIKEGTKKFDTWVERQKYDFVQEYSSGLIPSENKSFSEYSRYFIDLKKRDKKPRTIEGYTDILKRIDPYLGHMKIRDIRAEHLNRFYDSLAEAGLTPRTINHYHAFIHAVFGQAYKEGLILTNTADRATPPKVANKEAEFFELATVLDILEKLSNEPIKWRAITTLLIYTGARRGEIMGLKWEDIDLQNNTISICRNLQSRPGGNIVGTPKNGESRCVMVDDSVSDLLQHLKLEQELEKRRCGDEWIETGYCFTQENGLPMNTCSINKWLGLFAKKYGFSNCHPHKFRHTHISLLIHQGLSPTTVAKQAGHKQVSTTLNTYSHAFADSNKEAAQAIHSLLNTKQA